MQAIRVGVVGAHPERSWAKDSHIPAIAQIPGLRLTAVATRSEESARIAAQAYRAGKWFSDAVALCGSDAVDLVAVCVKVPEHAAVVRAALAAAKHLYCEWPLGRSVGEADALSDEAARAGVHHAIGLQGSAAPAVRRACELVAAGRLGRLLSARAVSTTAGYAPRLPSAYAYLNQATSGANLSTILGGHTLDLAERVLGPIRAVDAVAAIQHPIVHLIATGGMVTRDTPDQLFVLSQHEGGCVASIEIGGDRPGDTPFLFDVTGEAGTLRLLGGHPHGFQAGELRLEIDGVAEPVEAPLAAGGLRGAAVNVAEVYAALARDIREDRWSVADFEHAARLTRLVDSVGIAAATGERQVLERIWRT